MSDDILLKPCPFCGSRVEIHEFTIGDNPDTYYEIWCTNEKCIALGCDTNKYAIVNNWNRRLPPPEYHDVEKYYMDIDS